MYKVYGGPQGANIQSFEDLDEAKMSADKIIEDIEIASDGFQFYEISVKDSEGNVVYHCSTFGNL